MHYFHRLQSDVINTTRLIVQLSKRAPVVTKHTRVSGAAPYTRDARFIADVCPSKNVSSPVSFERRKSSVRIPYAVRDEQSHGRQRAEQNNKIVDVDRFIARLSWPPYVFLHKCVQRTDIRSTALCLATTIAVDTHAWPEYSSTRSFSPIFITDTFLFWTRPKIKNIRVRLRLPTTVQVHQVMQWYSIEGHDRSVKYWENPNLSIESSSSPTFLATFRMIPHALTWPYPRQVVWRKPANSRPTSSVQRIFSCKMKIKFVYF